MPAKSDKPERKAPVQEGRKAGEKRRTAWIEVAVLVAVPVVLLLLLFFLVLLPSQITVPFSTFKANFDSAQRVAVVLSYLNQSQFIAVSQCATQVVQVIAHTRNASTIDFYLMNRTTCTYPEGGLGHTVSILNSTPSKCLDMVGSEPAVFLNYSQSDYSVVTAYKFYTYGNVQLMAACPVAVDLS